MRVITGSGNNLRKYLVKNDPQNAILYPEAGLDANEQARYIASLSSDVLAEDVDIFTLSPWLITEVNSFYVVEDDLQIKECHRSRYRDRFSNGTGLMGASVNKVTMALWRRETIGQKGLSVLSELKKEAAKPDVTVEKLDDLMSRAYEKTGDSVERVLTIKLLLDRQEKLKNKLQLKSEDAHDDFEV